MSIKVIVRFAGRDPIELFGCESSDEVGGRPVKKRGNGGVITMTYPSGTLVLRFDKASTGQKKLAELYAVDEGGIMTGKIEVSDTDEPHLPPITYDAGYTRHSGTQWEFDFACLPAQDAEPYPTGDEGV